MRHERFPRDDRIGSSFAAAALFAPALIGLGCERMCAALLGSDLRLLRMATFAAGTARVVQVPLRALMRDALSVDARALVIAHNHPGGDSRPSAADRAATRRLAQVAHMLDIRLIDHLVFAGGEVVSFRELGLL